MYLLWEEACSASKNTCLCASSSASKEINNFANFLSENARLLACTVVSKKVIKLTRLLILKHECYLIWNAGGLNIHSIYSNISINCYTAQTYFLRQEGEEIWIFCYICVLEKRTCCWWSLLYCKAKIAIFWLVSSGLDFGSKYQPWRMGVAIIIHWRNNTSVSISIAAPSWGIVLQGPCVGFQAVTGEEHQPRGSPQPMCRPGCEGSSCSMVCWDFPLPSGKEMPNPVELSFPLSHLDLCPWTLVSIFVPWYHCAFIDFFLHDDKSSEWLQGGTKTCRCTTSEWKSDLGLEWAVSDMSRIPPWCVQRVLIPCLNIMKKILFKTVVSTALHIYMNIPGCI